MNYLELKNIQTKNDLKGFVQLPIQISRKVSKNTKKQVPQIIVGVDKQNLNIRLKNGNDMLDLDKLNRIILRLELPLKDARQYDIDTWNAQAYVRFAKGTYANSGDNYYHMEVFFKPGLYVVHFLSYDQVDIIEILKTRGKLKEINFVEKPVDSIETEEIDTEIDGAK